MYSRRNKKAFTLVELIVVIVILAILATIAFLSFSSQSSSARDSTRLADMSNIAKGLSVFNAMSGKYPLPDSSISITASGVTISKQGYAGTSVLGMIKLSDGGRDPLDIGTYYTYATNAAQSRFQLLGFLEDGSNVALSFIPSVGNDIHAEPVSYSGRYAYSKGDVLGILLDGTTKIPIQSYKTDIDLRLADSSTIYDAVFGNGTTETTPAYGTGLISDIISRRSDLVSDKNLASMDESLIGYWDMSTTTMSGSQIVLKDLSGKGNNGTCYESGTQVDCGIPSSGPQVMNGKMSFDGIDDFIHLKGF